MNDCRTYWGSHGCIYKRGHRGRHECDCCECYDHARQHEVEGCVARAPYYGRDTHFYGEDAEQVIQRVPDCVFRRVVDTILARDRALLDRLAD